MPSVSALGRDDYTMHHVRRSTLDVLRGAAATLSGDAAPIVLLEVNRQTTTAPGYEPVDLVAELRRHNPYELFRVQEAALVPEQDPGTAHGVTWVPVPPGRRDRV